DDTDGADQGFVPGHDQPLLTMPDCGQHTLSPADTSLSRARPAPNVAGNGPAIRRMTTAARRPGGPAPTRRRKACPPRTARRPGPHDQHPVQQLVTMTVIGHPVQFRYGERLARRWPRFGDAHDTHAASITPERQSTTAPDNGGRPTLVEGGGGAEGQCGPGGG